MPAECGAAWSMIRTKRRSASSATTTSNFVLYLAFYELNKFCDSGMIQECAAA